VHTPGAALRRHTYWGISPGTPRCFIDKFRRENAPAPGDRPRRHDNCATRRLAHTPSPAARTRLTAARRRGGGPRRPGGGSLALLATRSCFVRTTRTVYVFRTVRHVRVSATVLRSVVRRARAKILRGSGENIKVSTFKAAYSAARVTNSYLDAKIAPPNVSRGGQSPL
jgi:hypothetical protein